MISVVRDSWWPSARHDDLYERMQGRRRKTSVSSDGTLVRVCDKGLWGNTCSGFRKVFSNVAVMSSNSMFFPGCPRNWRIGKNSKPAGAVPVHLRPTTQATETFLIQQSLQVDALAPFGVSVNMVCVVSTCRFTINTLCTVLPRCSQEEAINQTCFNCPNVPYQFLWQDDTTHVMSFIVDSFARRESAAIE